VSSLVKKVEVGVIEANGNIRAPGRKFVRVDPKQDWRPMLGCEVEFVYQSGLGKRKTTTTGAQGTGRVLKVLKPSRTRGGSTCN